MSFVAPSVAAPLAVKNGQLEIGDRGFRPRCIARPPPAEFWIDRLAIFGGACRVDTLPEKSAGKDISLSQLPRQFQIGIVRAVTFTAREISSRISRNTAMEFCSIWSYRWRDRSRPLPSPAGIRARDTPADRNRCARPATATTHSRVV